MDAGVKNPPTVRVFATAGEVADAAAQSIAALAREAIAARRVFHIALAGGSTPKAAYERLAAMPGVDWPNIHCWFGDERCVPADHEHSNERMARAALLSRVAIPPANIHRVKTELAPARAAADYERELRSATGGRGLDLVLAGVGGDGHTLSLFPGSPALAESTAWVVATHAPPASPVRDRVTLTYPAVAAARRVMFLVTGPDKAAVAAEIIDHPPGAADHPAGRLRAKEGVEWLLDAGAASRLKAR